MVTYHTTCSLVDKEWYYELSEHLCWNCCQRPFKRNAVTKNFCYHLKDSIYNASNQAQSIILKKLKSMEIKQNATGLVKDCVTVYLGIFANKIHDVSPVPVYCLELASFLRHLLHDVLRTKDRLQVQPLGLNF